MVLKVAVWAVCWLLHWSTALKAFCRIFASEINPVSRFFIEAGFHVYYDESNGWLMSLHSEADKVLPSKAQQQYFVLQNTWT